jgi:A/G-specific adenine glycosylase
MFEELISWSKDHCSHLPWRKNRSIYRTLVSEIMLQQTTVGTVVGKFEDFLKIYPDILSLSNTTEAKLLSAWKGLGYYRRAKNLKIISDEILVKYKGKIPDELDLLKEIKGIGPYTASAVRAIGYDKPALAIDANIERVLSRFFGIKEKNKKKLHENLSITIEKKKVFKTVSPRAFNEALMDVGRTFCQAKSAKCELCPLVKDCQGKKSPFIYPVPYEKKIKVSFEAKLLRLVVIKKNKILVYQKEKGEWLSGQYEIPTFIIETNDPLLKQYPEYKKKIDIKNLKSFKTGITKYELINFVLELSESEFNKMKFPKKTIWMDLSEKEHFSVATQKTLKLVNA